ncbi:MAG: hypothetical protein VCB99_04205 [Myxococcota bacterium]
MGKAVLLLLAALLLPLSSGTEETTGDVATRGEAGKPDLNGTWQAFNRANFDLEHHPARAAMALREGPHGPLPAKEVVALGAVAAVPAGLGVVVGGEIPYQPWAKTQREKNRAEWLSSDPEIKCYLPGIPRATYLPYPFQIIQNEQALFFAYEYAGAVRDIHLTDPGPAPLDSWMGQSVGSWEGETLVVETTGQNALTWLDRSGNFHSEELRVVERFTPTRSHTLAYEATLEDPEVFTRPWKIRMTLYRLVGDDSILQRFNCIEFVEELIYGHLRKEPLD